MAELSDAAAITLTVGYFGASGSSSMAAARSALPVAGCCGATKAVAPAVSARIAMTDLRCTAVRVMHDKYLHSVTYCMVMFVRSLQGVKTRCQTKWLLHEDLDFLTKATDVRTPSGRIHHVEGGWQRWKTAEGGPGAPKAARTGVAALTLSKGEKPGRATPSSTRTQEKNRR